MHGSISLRDDRKGEVEYCSWVVVGDVASDDIRGVVDGDNEGERTGLTAMAVGVLFPGADTGLGSGASAGGGGGGDESRGEGGLGWGPQVDIEWGWVVASPDTRDRRHNSRPASSQSPPTATKTNVGYGLLSSPPSTFFLHLSAVHNHQRLLCLPPQPPLTLIFSAQICHITRTRMDTQGVGPIANGHGAGTVSLLVFFAGVEQRKEPVVVLRRKKSQGWFGWQRRRQ
ncbi:hypothetical protein STAS_10468 [Striga asiatica]|uniref:Uncharacterized protein n=1 Tax=Striga asiatica TaxID=4170 RepID=A0A5A7PNR2_STRAF|nr:hypothetical protein STAS_10468 [Striga asiatica]